MSLLLAFQGAPPVSPDLIFVVGELLDEAESDDPIDLTVLVLEDSALLAGVAQDVDDEQDEEAASVLVGQLTDAQLADNVAISAMGLFDPDGDEEQGDEWAPGRGTAAVTISDDLVAVLGMASEATLIDDDDADALAAYGASEFPPDGEGGDAFYHRRYRRISYR